MDDWIEHHGKGNPDLPPDTQVRTRHSNGWTDDGATHFIPSWEYWSENDSGENAWVRDGMGDIYITHYQLLR